MKKGFRVLYYNSVDGNTDALPRCWMLSIVLLVVCISPSICQSSFTIKIDNHNRGYLLTTSGSEAPNLPLVIILHPDGSNARETFHSESLWKKLSRPAVLVFPLSVNNRWICQDSTSSTADQKFLSAIIDQAYDNYHVDRNRVYIIASGDGYCISQDFYNSYPKKVTRVFEYSVKVGGNEDSITPVLDRFIPTAAEKEMGYQLWRKVRLDSVREEKAKIDSIKANRWARRTTFALKASRFFMLPTVNTGIDDKTYMDITNVRTLYTFEVTQWMNDSMAWFVDVSWLKIPNKQEVSFDFNGANTTIKGEGGGGAIIPLSVGFKYALHHNAFRPYFELSTGPMAVTVIGGKFRANSTNMDPSQIASDLKSESRLVMHITLGTGYEWRLGKRIYNTAQLKYIHSGQFDSVGQVNAIKGFSIAFGLGYVMGIKKDLKALSAQR